ncbi:MAG: hypothetical protein KBB75_00860 [Candidatus Pacebacteria bacterium]|jgi:uncharacterized membrane protein|nr:hypothetical protein [Candidatus Paceibacterota bacterium]
MDFGFIPVAEASVETLMKSINKVIINPLILFLFSIALVYFIYGLVQYFLSPDNEEVRKTSKTHMVWGVIGLFIMVSVFGILRLVLGTVGETKIKIQNTGDYEVNKVYQADQGALNMDEQPLSGGTIFTTDGGVGFDPLGGGTVNVNPYLPPILDESELPLPKEILDAIASDPLYYRTFGSGKKTNAVDAKLTALKNAEIRLAGLKGARSVDVVKGRTIIRESQKVLGGFSHYFVAVSYPKEIISAESTLPVPDDMKSYRSDSSYYRALGSGQSADLAYAKRIAIRNARVQIGAEKRATSIDSINYVILKERAFKSPDGLSHYFVVLSHPK